MRGRKPIPTAIHRIKGTFRPARHGKGRRGEPQPTGDISRTTPEWMTDSQKASWLYAVGNAPAGVLKAIDAGVLAVWVVAEDQHRRATEAQACLDAGKTLPLVTKGRRGVIVASPYLKIIAQAGDRMRAAAAQLGFSPAARPRTPPPAQPPRASPWGRFEVLPGEKK